MHPAQPGYAPAEQAGTPWHVHVLAGLQSNCEAIKGNLERLRQGAADRLQPASLPRPGAGGALAASVGAQALGGAAASSSSGVSKEEIGRATWIFLHTLAAQYPERPSRQQQKDVRNLVSAPWPHRRLPQLPQVLGRLAPPPSCPTHRLRAPAQVDILTRIYPCRECAEHFREVVRQRPPAVGSHADLELWTCEVHNVVNRRLGKPTFNCRLVASRWGGVDCADADACSLSLGAQRRQR